MKFKILLESFLKNLPNLLVFKSEIFLLGGASVTILVFLGMAKFKFNVFQRNKNGIKAAFFRSWLKICLKTPTQNIFFNLIKHFL
jgi:hypothetical protein